MRSKANFPAALRRLRLAGPEATASRWQRVGVALTGLVVVLLSALALLLIALHSPPGRRLVADQLAQRLSRPGLTVTVGRLEGSPLRTFTLGAVEVSDAGGPLLRVDRVRVGWRPLSMLLGPWKLGRVEAERVEVLRRLDFGGAISLAVGSEGVERLPYIQHLSVEQLELRGSGEALVYRLVGRLIPPTSSGGLEMRLMAQSTKGPPARTDFSLRTEAQTRRAVITVAADEPRDGPLAAMLGLSADGPLKLEASGEGTLDKFSAAGVLTAGAGRAELAVHLDRVGARRLFRLTAGGDLSAAVDSAVAPMLAGLTELRAAGSVQPGGRIDLQMLRLRTAAGSLTAKGEIDLEGGQTDLLLDLEAGESSRLSGLLGADIHWRGLTASGRLAGRLASLGVSSRGRIDGLSRGQAAEVASPDVPPAGELRWDFGGTAQGLKVVHVDRLEVNAGQASLRYEGALGLAGADGTFEAKNIDLAAVPDAFASRLGGIVGAAGRIRADAGWRNGRIDLDGGHAEALRSDAPRLAPLLAGDMTAKGGVSWSEGGIGLDGFELRGPNLLVEGNGRSDAGGLGMTLRVPDLAVLDPALSGTLGARVRLDGLWDSLQIQVRGDLSGTAVHGLPLTSVTIDLSGRWNGGVFEGLLRTAGSPGGEALLALATVSRTAEGATSFRPIEGMFGSLHVSGGLTVDAGGSSTGRLELVSASLGELATAFGIPVSGRARGTIEIRPGPDGPSLMTQGLATEVRLGAPAVHARSVAFAGEWTGRKAPRGSVIAEGLSIAGIDVDRLRVTLEKRETATLVEADAAGPQLQFSSRGRVVPLAEETRVGIETMLLSLNGETIALPNPTLLKVFADRVTFDGALLSSGEGEMIGSGDIGQALDLRLTGNCVPLSLARMAYKNADLQGCVSGTLSLTGRRRAPSGRYNLTLVDAGRAGPTAEKLAGRMEGGFTPETFSTEASIAGPHTNLVVQGSWPRGEGPIGLQVKGRLDLATAGALQPDAGLAGTLSGDMTFSGTRRDLRLAGSVDLADAAMRVGTFSIGNARGSLAAHGERLEVARFEGNLSEGGQLSAQGAIAFGTGAAAGIDLRFGLDGVEFRPIPGFVARGDAALTVTGPLAGPRLDGLVELREARLLLSDRGAAAEPAAAPDVPAWMAVRLRVKAANGFHLAGRGIDAEFAGGEFLVQGTGPRSGPSGEFAFRVGGLDIAGARLPFTGGMVSFANDWSPVLTLESVRDDPEGSVRLNVAGPLDRPTITVTGAPPVSEEQALSRLLFAAGAGGRAKDPAFLASALSALQAANAR